MSSHLFELCCLRFWYLIQKKIVAKTNAKEIFLIFFFYPLESFMVSSLTLKFFFIHFHFWEWSKVCIQFHSFVCEYPVFREPFFEEIILSPLCVLHTTVRGLLTVHMGLFLGSLFCYFDVCACFYASSLAEVWGLTFNPQPSQESEYSPMLELQHKQWVSSISNMC